MLFQIKIDPSWGPVLMLCSDKTEIGIALNFGIRIIHLSHIGMPNLLYRQPDDLSDGYTTDAGWRLYGGHRLWLAPESDRSTYPDNESVTYKILEDGVELVQQPDPWLQIIKFLRIKFCEDGFIQLTHSIKNCGSYAIRAALWGITTLSGGGIADVSFSGTLPPDDLTPKRTVSLWADTNLGDPRVSYEKDRITFRHIPSDDFFKIGVFSKDGKMSTENFGQRLEIFFESNKIDDLPDFGCNAEIYLDRNFIELESLGIMQTIPAGQYASHTELWRVLQL